jgi:hypothetical protein
MKKILLGLIIASGLINTPAFADRVNLWRADDAVVYTNYNNYSETFQLHVDSQVYNYNDGREYTGDKLTLTCPDRDSALTINSGASLTCVVLPSQSVEMKLLAENLKYGVSFNYSLSKLS